MLKQLNRSEEVLFRRLNSTILNRLPDPDDPDPDDPDGSGSTGSGSSSGGSGEGGGGTGGGTTSKAFPQ